MAVVDEFTGRKSPSTGAVVTMWLLRSFNRETLQDVWGVVLESGARKEEFLGLTYSQAMSKWRSNKKWWE